MQAGGATTFVSAADIDAHEDLDRADVTVRLAGGAQTRFTRPPALSLNALLVLAGLNPATVGYVAVARPNGSLVQLRGEDLAAAAASPDGPPAFWIDDTSTHFLRTARDDTDVNATDSVATVSGQPLTVDVHAGALIAVTATATPTSTNAGTPVTLTASADASAGDLTYTWDLGDGTTATGATVTHAYATAGRYQPHVVVAGPGDSGGASAPVTLTIGAAPAPAGEAKTTGGGTRDPQDAAATGTTKKTKTTKQAKRTPAAQQTTTTAAPAIASAPTPAAAPAAASPTPTPAAPATTPTTPQRPQTRQRRPRRTPKPAPAAKPTSSEAPASGTRVSGILIAGSDAAAITAGLDAAANPTPAAALPGARRGGGSSSPFPTGTVVAIAAVLTLLALGATREARRR